MLSSVIKHISIRHRSLTAGWMALLFCVLLGGCQKSPINGNLDGQWQVMEVTPEPPEEILYDTRLYITFYLHSCMLTYYGGILTNGNFKYDGETIYMDFPYMKTERDALILKQYGIDSNPVVFDVEKLDKNKMVLRNGNTTVSLRKF